MILVCGEALYDVFVTDGHGAGFSFDARPGGSPFNVAFGLARLGQQSAFLGGFSTDFLGARLLSFLADEGVSAAFVQRRDRPTTLAVAGLAQDGSAAYAFYGENAADRAVLLDEVPPLPETLRAIHLSSFSNVVEPVGSSLERLVARECGTRLVSYDPNIRPGIEPDMQVWRRKLAALLDVAHVIKLSREDFDLLFPGGDPDVLARDWLGRSVRLVVLTEGGGGSIAWTRRHRLAIPAVPVDVVDTVGAGDTYQAALLTALAETDRLAAAALDAIGAEALRPILAFAAQAAAMTCSRRGADMPRRSELPPLAGSR